MAAAPVGVKQVGASSYRHTATANGVTATFDAPANLPLTYEAVAVSNRVGVLIRDPRGEPLVYRLRDG